MNMFRKVVDAIKDIIIIVVGFIFVLLAAPVIHLSGADKDSWPKIAEKRNSDGDGPYEN